METHKNIVYILADDLGYNDLSCYGQKKHEYLYWEFHERGGRKALRKGNWKLVNYNVFDLEKTTVELYNIATDPSEQSNVAAAHPEIAKEISALMKSARTESEVFIF